MVEDTLSVDNRSRAAIKHKILGYRLFRENFVKKVRVKSNVMTNRLIFIVKCQVSASMKKNQLYSFMSRIRWCFIWKVQLQSRSWRLLQACCCSTIPTCRFQGTWKHCGIVSITIFFEAHIGSALNWVCKKSIQVIRIRLILLVDILNRIPMSSIGKAHRSLIKIIKNSTSALVDLDRPRLPWELFVFSMTVFDPQYIRESAAGCRYSSTNLNKS